MHASPPHPGLIEDRFLSDALGVPVLRLTGSSEIIATEGGEHLSGAVFWTRVPTTETEQFDGLLRRGFRLVTTEVQLEHPWEGTASLFRRRSGARVRVRPALPIDEESVCEIAATAFSEDRFHRDPAISDDAAGRVKKAWARNFFRGLRGDRMLVAEDSAGSVAGFVQILDLPDAAVIDLIAVAPGAQRQGTGRALTCAVLDDAQGSSRAVRVGTQLTNTRSLRLYTRLGFTIVASTHTLHHHLPPLGTVAP